MTGAPAATPPLAFGNHIVFVDESGDHSLTSINPDYPVFVLAFCILPRAAYIEQITPAVRRLKFALFGHDLVILHEHDIRKKTGPFAQLGKERRDALMQGLTGVIAVAPMTLVAVVIDKFKHKARYAEPFNPYDLALQYGLERVFEMLRSEGQEERLTHVICEARGKQEDAELELEFRRVCDGKNRHGRRLNFEVVMASKQTNSEGLQLADLVARPIGLHVLRPDQPNRAWDVLKTKIYAGQSGRALGWGLKIFP